MVIVDYADNKEQKQGEQKRISSQEIKFVYQKAFSTVFPR